jgi:hypothetical protein
MANSKFQVVGYVHGAPTVGLSDFISAVRTSRWILGNAGQLTPNEDKRFNAGFVVPRGRFSDPALG